MVPGMPRGHGQSLQPAAYVAELALAIGRRARGSPRACSGTLLLALSGVLLSLDEVVERCGYSVQAPDHPDPDGMAEPIPAAAGVKRQSICVAAQRSH